MKRFILIILFVGCAGLVEAQAQRPFITTWETTTDGESITIPTAASLGVTYNYTVDWGDGDVDTDITTDGTHVYDAAGIYTVSISGNFPLIYFFNQGDKEKIKTIEQWGDIEWEYMQDAFHGCSNLTYNATDAPDLSRVRTLISTFAECTNFNGDISNWDVSSIVNMENTFVNATTFNQDLNSWNTSKVTTMSSMFYGASSFNGNISGWDISSVNNMQSMFADATNFNGDLSSWNTANVTDMRWVFYGAYSFNRDISGWDVSKVNNMFSMFNGAIDFNQDLSSWDVSSVTIMDYMFRGARSFNSDIKNWTVDNVTTMLSMFENASLFNQDLSSWDVGNVTNMSNMFNNTALSKPYYDNILSNWSSLPTLQPDVELGALGLTFCDSDAERSSLINDFGWTISGDSIVCENSNPTDIKLSNASLTEGNDIGETIGEFSTVDQNRDNFTYTLVSGEGDLDNNSFSIDGNQLKAEIVFDYDVQSSYTIRVQTNDENGGLFEKQFTIKDISQVDLENAFITSWETTTDGETITIPINPDGVNYNYSVNWGDGNTEVGFKGNATHQYESAGVYSVSISGDFPTIYFNNRDQGSNNREKIKSIEQWGNNKWLTMGYSFINCINLTYNATDIPDLSSVTDMGSMFDNAESFNGNIGNWDVSNITDVSWMFAGAISFNQDISTWDVSSVTNMTALFASAYSFNQDLSNWDVSNVTNMLGLFNYAYSFNQNLGDWDVSSVTNMDLMFAGNALSIENYENTLTKWAELPSLQDSVSFGAYNLVYCQEEARNILIDDYGWDISGDSKVCDEVNRPFITTWKTTSNDEMISIPIFGGGNYTVDWGDGSVETGLIGNTTHTYENAGIYQVEVSGKFNQIRFDDTKTEFKDKLLTIEEWGDAQWRFLSSGFSECKSFTYNATDIPDLTNVTSLSNLFNNATSFNGDISDWDVSNIIYMGDLFSGSGLTVETYDKILIGWAALPDLENGVNLGAEGLSYCESEEARNTLINDFGWTITGDSKECGNLAPYDIKLSSVEISEGTEVDELIGTFTSFDRNENDTHSYTFIAGEGDVDNSSFTITGDQLLSAEVFNYDTKSEYSIRVKTDDGNGGLFEKEFIINIVRNQIITFDELEEKTYGDPVFELTATTNSDLPITYTSSDESIASISGSTVTIMGAGTTIITATQDGDAEYPAADPVEKTLTVNKADQNITIAAIADKLETDKPFEVEVTVNSGLELTYSIEGPASISGTTITLDGESGNVSLTVSQEGNENYNAASANESFAVGGVTSNDEALKKQISIFPNPTANSVQIMHAAGVKNIALYNAQGKMLFTQKVEGTAINLQMNNLPAGLYFIQLDSSALMHRIVKQ